MAPGRWPRCCGRDAVRSASAASGKHARGTTSRCECRRRCRIAAPRWSRSARSASSSSGWDSTRRERATSSAPWRSRKRSATRRARECFESTDATEEIAVVLNMQGLLEGQLGNEAAAMAAYREALAWAQRAPRDAGLEVAIRLNLAELHLEAGRFLDGEEEMRRA